MAENAPYLPLKGVRVIDVTTVLMGPFATQILGDMGADVVKIEPPAGDSHRYVGQAKHADLGPNFINTGRNKRSIVVDLKRPEAHEIVARLVADADVFVSNMRPAAMERLRLDYPTLRSLNDNLIYVSLVGFGREGRYAGLPAYDDLIQAAVGIPWLFQHAGGGEPRYIPLALCDRVVGIAAVNTIASALFARQRGEGGREIEVPMFETMARLILGDHLGQHVYDPATGPVGYPRLLSKHRRPYKTRDGYIGVLPFADKHWKKLFRLAGREDLLAGAEISDRTANFDELYGLLSSLLTEKTSTEWLALLRQADIPAMPMNSPDDLIEDPHLADVGFFQLRDHPSEGKVRMMTVPDGVAPPSALPITPAPRLGQHTIEILREAGFSQERVHQLIDGGVVVQHAEATEPVP